MPGRMFFLCGVNPQAGSDSEIMSLVKKTFGPKTNVTLLEEESDIYVLCDASEEVLDRLREIQADPRVIDTQIEVLRTSFVANRQVKANNVFLVLADIAAGKVDVFMEAMKAEVDRVGSGDAELLYLGEIFSSRADVAVMIATQTGTVAEIGSRVRRLSGVVDTFVYRLRSE